MTTNNSNMEFIKPRNKPEICQVVASINENVGGTAIFVSRLAEELYKQELSSSVFTLYYTKRGKQIINNTFKVYSYHAHFLARNMRGFHPQAYHNLCKLASTQLQLIHSHGLWMFPNLYARQAALKYDLPLMISPHGMLESWSLNHSRVKKWFAWLLYEQKNLNSATVFHATSHSELKSIRSLGLKQPVAIIPSGVDIVKNNPKPDKEKITELFPNTVNKKWLLFFSRIHPKKGLDNLLYVWQEIADIFSDWHLIIAGPDLIGYQQQLELLVEKLNLKQSVTFTGMLTGDYKIAALSNADLFVLPTHSENFGIAIAESLAYGVPVITTKGAPWQDLETYGCGWWIEDNQPALKNALLAAMEISDSQRQARGLKGKNLVKSKYSWNSVAKDMTSVYYWILNGGEPPNCVDIYNSQKKSR